jgi:hypothetical protein
MKTRYFKSTLLLALMLISFTLEAQTLKKDFHKEYNTTGSSELKIDNQFGNITVTDWDQNNVVIDVNIEVTCSDESKAQKLLDKINIDFKEEGNKITATTKLGDNGKLNLNNSKGNKQSFSINYTVKCPKGIQLSLDNQFGDMIVASLTGSFSADIQFGSLNAVSLTGPETNIDAQFGKVTIGTMKDGKFDIQHCESVKVAEGGNFTVDAQFSKIDMGSLVSLKADLDHSEVTVEAVTDMLNLEANFGNIKVNNVSAGFKSIEIEQNMGDVTIGIDPKAGYKLNAEVNMGSLKVPEEMKVSKQKETDHPGVSMDKISGVFGDGISTVKINANMGSVKIK